MLVAGGPKPLMASVQSIITRYRSDGLGGVARAIVRHIKKPRSRVHPLQLALREVFRPRDYTIVQLGAYVGNTDNDPIFSTLKRLSAGSQNANGPHGNIILVEPVRQYFEQLRINYSDVPGV